MYIHNIYIYIYIYIYICAHLFSLLYILYIHILPKKAKSRHISYKLIQSGAPKHPYENAAFSPAGVPRLRSGESPSLVGGSRRGIRHIRSAQAGHMTTGHSVET